MERLQKYMARCGIASRRQSEKIIQEGRVKVNGKIITEMGYKVKEEDVVVVDQMEAIVQDLKYYVMNKPRYIITSSNDEKNRKTVLSVLPDELKQYRLFPVGRLDYDTKGVLLLTNDGHFMNTLVGPNSHLEKEYLVRVEGIITKDELKKLSNGIELDGFKTKKCKTYLSSIDYENKSSLIGIVLEEGKYHQVKRMVEAIGHPAKRLTRIRFGCIYIENLPEGQVRPLTPHEIKILLSQATKENGIKAKKVRIFS